MTTEKERPVPILMYHRIGGGDAYSVDAGRFREQMRYLRGNGYRTLLPEELASAGGGAGRRVMITFDDGHASDYTDAWPVLEACGFRAVLFVTTGYVGTDGYLTWSQVRELNERGFSVQSHTHTHAFLGGMDEADIRHELGISRRLIEDSVGQSPSCLSLPGGSYSRLLRTIAPEEGYRSIFTSRPAPGSARSPAAGTFGRMPITRKTTLDGFAAIVRCDPGTYAAAAAKYLLKTIAKRCVGMKNYHALWSRYVKHS